MDKAAEGVESAVPGGRRLLVFLPTGALHQVIESFLVALLAAGHQIVVALDQDRKGSAAEGTSALDALQAQHPALARVQPPRRRDLWRIPASAIRRRLDYLRFLEPDQAAAAGHPAPPATWGMRVLLFLPPFRWSFGRHLLVRFFGRLEAAMPIPRTLRTFISEQSPGLVLVSPLTEIGAAQADYLRAAQAEEIPSLVIVPSHEDLTGQGGIRDVATLTLVPSENDVEDAVRLHDLPRDRVADLTAPGGADEAVQRAAEGEVEPRRQGRILRPVLWLLTPVMALLLPLVRPRATAAAVGRAVSELPKRIRKRSAASRKLRDHRRRAKAGAAKQKAVQAKQEKLARAEEVRERKLARAEAKGKRAKGAPSENGKHSPDPPQAASGPDETQVERTGAGE